MKKTEQFTEKYSISKTLRIGLIPQGKTEEYFDRDNQLATDEERAADYVTVKALMDRYHKDYIERALCDYQLPFIGEYVQTYYGRNEDREKKLMEYSSAMRADIFVEAIERL